jgi:hypothetical protein
MTVADRVFGWRCRRAVRLLEMQRQRTLESELAALSTTRERNDLLALLDAYDDDQTAEIREILVRQSLESQRRNRPVAGFRVPRTGW